MLLCSLLIFFDLSFFFSKKIFWPYMSYHSMKPLGPDHFCHFGRPNLGPYCLQRLSADQYFSIFLLPIPLNFDHLLGLPIKYILHNVVHYGRERSGSV